MDWGRLIPLTSVRVRSPPRCSRNSPILDKQFSAFAQEFAGDQFSRALQLPVPPAMLHQEAEAGVDRVQREADRDCLLRDFVFESCSTWSRPVTETSGRRAAFKGSLAAMVEVQLGTMMSRCIAAGSNSPSRLAPRPFGENPRRESMRLSRLGVPARSSRGREARSGNR
jgi:hypothetical protein